MKQRKIIISIICIINYILNTFVVKALEPCKIIQKYDCYVGMVSLTIPYRHHVQDIVDDEGISYFIYLDDATAKNDTSYIAVLYTPLATYNFESFIEDSTLICNGIRKEYGKKNNKFYRRDVKERIRVCYINISGANRKKYDLILDSFCFWPNNIQKEDYTTMREDAAQKAAPHTPTGQ